ncbi:leukotoxin LktA family filamentous adhesin [Bosea sp. BH3]|uniref:leukotoxin LktA family filamentous adhesin n=1 Tax=Bosea sp. BH3 TaxID=2871701 RepID=UPI0021CAEDBE|nr:leukotoxin LktA family filamentous adhesin [Bosea sp. BH3]MCU4179932.1 leukotoxin LktA family filamentous adhesin [Bosea sp. BH3]
MSRRRAAKPSPAPETKEHSGTRHGFPHPMIARPAPTRRILASWRQRCLVGQAMALALWNVPAFAQNIITPDGRTQTNVAVSGTTTTITTQTVSAGAGYNSFSRFEQAAGTTVNMHLPQNTGALVNIVRDGPVVINGILNSYRNGQIGGHVYFSDSAGFTVGPSGVINTGQLTVNTPTRDFLDQVIGPNGVVNEAMAARLRANDVPISPDGRITVDGAINARRGVTLNGHSVSVAGQITANAAIVDVGERRRRHQTAFAESVNTSGLQHGGAMVARKGGGIEIVAAGTVQVSGRLSANANGRRSAGTVALRSGTGTTIAQTAKISATGKAPLQSGATADGTVNTGEGGKVSIKSNAGITIASGATIDVSAAQDVAAKAGSAIVFADTNLDVASGAIFRGIAGTSGDGAFLELSAKDTVTLGAIDVDLSARNGAAGLLYIDPANIVIGGGGSANMITNGTNVSLEATNKITIAADGIIDTRQFNRGPDGDRELSALNPTTGNSGSITLTAPDIEVRGKLLAGVLNSVFSWSAGDVTLNATQSQTLIAGPASASASIKVSGTITGRDITMTADARAKSSFADPSAGTLVALAAQTLGGAMFGLNGAYVGSTISAKVEIEDNAEITATRDVKILANGVQEATLPAITISGNFPWGAGVSIAEISGEVKADVASGAKITVGRNLDVNAFNDINLMATALTLTTGSSVVAATVAYGAVDVTTSAKVHSGAEITATGTSRINVSAGNSNNFSTSATAMASAGSVGGIAFAYSDYKASAEAQFGASLGTSGSRIGSLTVQATSDTEKNATSASTTVGNNALFNLAYEGTTVSDLLTKIFGKLKTGSSSVPAKVGSAIAVANSSLSASATITADAGSAAPSIFAENDVVVVARQRDFGVRVVADSSTNSASKDPTAANPSADISLSFGIGVGDFKHYATASIGSGVSIDAERIGVAALNEMPISNTWENWGGLGETLTHVNGNMGIVADILTSYANASGQASQLGLAGAINYFRVDNESSAYVASGARLKQADYTGAWSTNLDYGYEQQWDKAVHIDADTVTHSIDIGGNFAFTGGTGGSGSAVGGSMLNIGRSSNTVAAVAAGVTIEATGVAVTAVTSDKMFVIATTSGNSAGTIGFNGIVSIAGMSNRTLASVSNLATITTSSLEVKADQIVSVFGLSGALARGGGNAVGGAVAVLDAASVTRAYIGDNRGDLAGNILAGTAAQGLITANTVDVTATTEGRITVASAAGVASGVGSGGGVEDVLADQLPDFMQDAAAAANSTSSSSISLTGAGTSSVALTTLGTSAWIDGAVIVAKDTDGLTTTVTALNSTIAEVAAGSAAINMAGNDSPLSGALAGAVAVAQFDNSTDARIAASRLTGVYDTTVQALSGGRATIVGLGVAGASSNGGAIALSAALGLVTNRVAASIEDSIISAVAGNAASQVVRVNAYQSTDIGIGGGAAYVGGQVGVGMALTYVDIRDPDGKDAVSAKVARSSLTGLDGLQVRATNASRIASSAATAGLGGNGLGGVFIINSVTPTTRAAITGESGSLVTVSAAGHVSVLADGGRIAAFDDLIGDRQAVSASDRSEIDFSGAAANGGPENPDGASVVAIGTLLQIGRNNAGVALLSNKIAQAHLASIDFATITATGDVSVVAQDSATITGVAVGLGAATGQFAGTASVVLQSIENISRAHIGGTGTVITAANIGVASEATSSIRGAAGSLGLGFGAAALGLSIVESNVANEVLAEVEGAKLRANRDVVLRAGSTATIDTIAIGIAMSRNVGLAGSVANNSVATNVGARISGADIVADNNLGVLAGNADRITVSAGALGATAGAPSVAGGLSVVNNTIAGSTSASIGEDSVVDARAGGNGLLGYNAGQLTTAFDLTTANEPSDAQPSLAMMARSIHGLGVVATSQQSVLANAVTGGVAIFPISGAVAIVPIRNVLAGSTSATIDGSLVNTRLTGTDSTAVAIEAASHSYAATFITVGSVGGLAAAGADANTIMARSTHAALTNSTLGTTTSGFAGTGVTSLDIAASASQSAASNVIGFAAGGGSAAAAGVVNSFAATTTATLDQGLVTAGRVAVNAESRNGFYAQAISAAIGGVSLGGSFVVGTSRNTTLATIGGGSGLTTLNLNGALAVAARSINAFTTLSAGGAAGGIAGVAGMVSFVDVENETRAGLYGVNATLRPASGASIVVTADETTSIRATTAAGANGGVGAGAAANIANLDSRVLADITGSTLSAPGAVSASATSDRIVDANTMTYGVGSSAGIGAAVAVISVGKGSPSSAGSELNAGGSGTLSRLDQLTAGNADLVLSASGLAAYRSYRGTAGASMSEAQLRDAAQADYNQLLANGTVVNGTLTLTASGVTALRSSAATALGIASPDDAQVRNWAAQRYTALNGGAVAYLMSDAGVSAYRATVTATTPDASDDQIRSAANDSYARLLANGSVSNGVLTLSGAGIAAYRTEASTSLGHSASDAEVHAYAANQYSFFNANRSRIVAPTSQSASALLDSAGSRTAATVTGGSIASGSVAVAALSRTTTTNIANGVGAGGAAGGGAATAYTDIGDDVSAKLDQITVNTGSIALSANSTDGSGAAARVQSQAGAGALAAAAGAAVADGSIANAVKATLGGSLTVTGATTVNAGNSQTSRSDAFGATVAGGLALGISLATSTANSTVAATYSAGSSLTGTGLTIGASSTGAAYAAAVAGVGGLLAAGSGAEANATDSSDVSAVIGAGARANVGTGSITLQATASPDAKAAAKGVAVAGGLAVGAAIANATVQPIVRAAIESNASLPASQFTAGTLSVLATGSVFGGTLGDAVNLGFSTSGFTRGGMSASASAIAGSGAYYVAAVGTDAQALNISSVTAEVGDYVRLSNGTVRISATNTTAQGATATGVTVAGTAAIGTVNAQADAQTHTTASIGNGVTMAAAGAGSFTLTAAGSDTQIVHATAGSGGLYAGSGATGSTSNTASVTASVGENARISTGLVKVGASHTTRYASLIDSLQASALGASASLAENSADVDVLTSLGAGSIISASGPNTAGCYLTSCLQAISLTSQNVFTQLDLGDSVQAAAGGGINGAGATSTTEIDGTSRVVLGDNVTLAGGASPTAAPGSILIQAWSELFGDDTATLTTGGLLQGAGVSTRYRADVDNEVTLGLRNALNSYGVINLGTYTIADVRANAYVSTYGLAGVGLADADVTIRTDNNVTVGANSALLGLYDVNITAGRDGSGQRTNNLSGNATALGYVRGLIAVPDADASTDLQNHAKVDIGSGATISSAQNVTLGAYDGLINARADGTGHGYQLYFIPVTTGSSSPGFSSTSTLVMNGTATAGIYNTQRIEIGCGANASVQCGPNETPTIRFVSGAPVTSGYSTAFDVVSYINANYDPTVAPTLLSGVSHSPVKAVRLTQLYAAGGNVYVSGSSVQGNGTLTAKGGPSITVINRSNAYLILDGGAYIPETTGGQIIGSTGSLTRHTNPDATPVIAIDNSYTGQLDASGNGPALLIAGDITNLSGVVSLNNTQGSFGFSGQRIDALQFNTTVPNGAVVVSSNGPNGMYNAGATPQAEYESAIYYPGGGPGDSFNVDQAVYAAANALAAGQGATDLNYFLYGRQDEGTTRNFSMQFYGNCIGYIGDAGYACTGGYDMGNDIRFMVIPTIQTYRQSNPTAEGGGTKIYGSQVAIKATTININAEIEAGRITNWSGTVDSGMVASLRNSRQYYLDRGYVEVGLKEALGGTWANQGAAPLYYDLANDRLVLWDINASSGGGSVLLDGQIISTNTLGSIKINGGFGDVSLNNTSGLDLVVNRVNTGTGVGVSASVSKITIIDRLVTDGPNTTIYAYTPGSGIATYKTWNGALPAQGATPYAFTAGSLTEYNPVAGTRYEWTQQILLQKEGLTPQTTQVRDLVSYWRYDSGTTSNPWVYVDNQSPSTNPGADWMYWWSRNAQDPSATGVSGRVTNNGSLINVGMTQEITGGQLDFINNEAHYSGCNLQAINHCDRDFVAQPGAGQAIWNYQMVTRAFVQVTASVKADNPFDISFAGNAAGRVNITSNGSVLQNGTIVNPSGTTTIVASGGSFTQTNNATILSNNLNLTARDSIGTQSAAIKATLTSGADLSAIAGSGGINLDITGGARVLALRADGNPNAYGDIRVRATGSLETVASANANVVGRNITLASENGSIGSVSNVMKMRAVATRLANGSYTDGVVNLSALGDIGIAQVSGDLRVAEIKSEAGDVRIDVNAGRLVSATGQTSAQALSAEQLSQVSRALKLTAADGADAAAQASIATFEAQVTQAYGLYSALIRNGSVDANGVFTLSNDGVALYQAFADAAIALSRPANAPPRAATPAEVRAYAAERYNAYAGAFKAAYGDGWATQARFNAASLESNFSFRTTNTDAAAGIANRIAGDAAWTDRQLVSAINQSALQPASGVVGNGTALVVGHDVTLNIAGSIGSLAPDMQVSLDNIRSGSITDAQLAALAVATTPGTVKIMGQRQDGSLVEVTDLQNVPAGVTLTRVDVKQTAPMFINATGAFSASAQGDVYVQATTNVRSSTTPRAAGATLTLGAISATGTVSLQAPQGIVVGMQADGTTPRSPVQIQTGGDLVLVAGGGGIGSAAAPLTYQIGGRLVSASAAAGDAYLVANAGNAEIGRIFATGTASLTARSGGIQGYLPGIAIAASSVALNATGNVGSAAAALGLQIGTGGSVSGQIGGLAWLSAPTVSGQSANTLRLGSLSAANGLTATSDGQIDVLDTLRSTAGAIALTGSRIVMAGGSGIEAAGRASLASGADIVLGHVVSALAAPAGSASIAITAAGSILGNGDAGTLLDAGQAGGAISLYAGGDIGSETAALVFSAPTLSARSLGGDINLGTAAGTHATELKADAGSVALRAGGTLTVDAVTSAGSSTLATSNGALTLGTLLAGSASSLDATSAITLTSATTSVGAFSATSGTGSISAGTVGAAGDATLTAATFVSVTGALTAGGDVSVTAADGAIDVGGLTAGGSLTMSSSAALALGAISSSNGSVSLTSTGAEISATSIAASGDVTLAAATGIAVTNALNARGAATATAHDGTLDIGSVSAGASSALSASGTVTLGTAATTAGDLSVASSAGDVNATSLSAAQALLVEAAGTVDVPTLLGGTDVTITAGGAVSVETATAGHGAGIDATGLVALGTVSAGDGGLTLVSRNAGITADRLDIGGDATISSYRGVMIGALTARGVDATTTTGAIDVTTLDAGGNASLRSGGDQTIATARIAGNAALISGGALRIDSLTSAGSAEIDSTGELRVADMAAGGDLRLASAQAGISFGALSSNGSAALAAANAIDGERIVASDALTLQAGRSGQGSISIGRGAALNASVSAADDVRLANFGAGNSITILGTRIAADIVQLPGAGGMPLALDIGGLRAAVAEAVDLRIDASRVRVGRFAALDSRLTTTAGEFAIASANVPGAMTLQTPVMTLFANNRSLAPALGYDIQLYPRSRPFYLTVNGARLATDAFIINFDSSVVDIPPSFGSSLARDMARLPNLLPSGPSFGEVARGFVFGLNSAWRSDLADPASTASFGQAWKPLVNLDEEDDAESQP